jgi:hypothetical protein
MEGVARPTVTCSAPQTSVAALLLPSPVKLAVQL